MDLVFQVVKESGKNQQKPRDYIFIKPKTIVL